MSPNPWVVLNTATSPTLRARELRRMWEGYLADGSVDQVRAPIADSWRRSEAADLSPSWSRAPTRLPDRRDVAERWQAHSLAGRGAADPALARAAHARQQPAHRLQRSRRIVVVGRGRREGPIRCGRRGELRRGDDLERGRRGHERDRDGTRHRPSAPGSHRPSTSARSSTGGPARRHRSTIPKTAGCSESWISRGAWPTPIRKVSVRCSPPARVPSRPSSASTCKDATHASACSTSSGCRRATTSSHSSARAAV